MADTSKDILRLFGEMLPKLTETDKEKLLIFGEGMAFMAAQRTQAAAPPNNSA